ncbi:hypothetical protein BDZ91DRAFT_728226, partial [Kalaharituber pfeilii]
MLDLKPHALETVRVLLANNANVDHENCCSHHGFKKLPHVTSTSNLETNTGATCPIAMAVETGRQETAELLVEAYLKQVNKP